MRPTLFTVDLPGPGRLSTMAKPRGDDWIDDEMTALRAGGVDILVCTLTGHRGTTGVDHQTAPEHRALTRRMPPTGSGTIRST
ncbi:hypothetical protein OH807_38055 [Kitasatospora sp. NBC_01560]|uniref:hypothetical protein n=1 Tax=Kitasatospora sp. NBC_01560 TaxID=2975965 RepID=UPI0038704167